MRSLRDCLKCTVVVDVEHTAAVPSLLSELETLEALLRSSAEARATLRSLATIDAKWQETAADEAFGKTSEPTAPAAGV